MCPPVLFGVQGVLMFNCMDNNTGTFKKESFVQPINELEDFVFGEVLNGLGLHFVGYEVVDGVARGCQWDLLQLKKFRVF